MENKRPFFSPFLCTKVAAKDRFCDLYPYITYNAAAGENWDSGVGLVSFFVMISF
jgi:hypothetical protein